MAKKKGENLYCPNQRVQNKKFRDGYDNIKWEKEPRKDNAQS